MMRFLLTLLFAITVSVRVEAEQPDLPDAGKAVEPTVRTLLADSTFPRFSGVYPHLAALSTSFTEAGIGAVVPWADRLWYISYVASRRGGGVGLYEIKPDLTVRRRPESIVGTHANRMIHCESKQLLIGPYLTDTEGNVRVFEDLATKERLTAVMRHLTDLANKVYFLAMGGAFYEADVHTLRTKRLFHLKGELGIEGDTHFKGGYTAQGRVVVANNSYQGNDQRDGSGNGRLGQWDGKTWTVLKRTAFCDVTTAHGVRTIPEDNSPLYAIGWDRRSVLLNVLTDGVWTTYRLPKGSQSYDHTICTEWPRIRETEPGHLMLDMHGLYYRMSPSFQAGNASGLSPIAVHLRMTPDFCRWQDRLVLAGNENSSMGNKHRTGGQPQSNLWFGSVEQLRQWGRPAGWGGPWHEDQIKAGIPSEPFFVGGFPRRVVHLSLNGGRDRAVRSTDSVVFTLEVDEDGTGTWSKNQTIQLPAGGYAYHTFPADFSGRWVRITADRDCVGSAQFFLGSDQRQERDKNSKPLFQSLPRVTDKKPRIDGGLLPFAGRLWFAACTTDIKGRKEVGKKRSRESFPETTPDPLSLQGDGGCNVVRSHEYCVKRATRRSQEHFSPPPPPSLLAGEVRGRKMWRIAADPR